MYFSNLINFAGMFFFLQNHNRNNFPRDNGRYLSFFLDLKGYIVFWTCHCNIGELLEIHVHETIVYFIILTHFTVKFIMNVLYSNHRTVMLNHSYSLHREYYNDRAIQ